MNLRFIETFLWIVRLGSFSAAAERLNTTQASISHRIATLERELGVQLFDREARNVTLTHIGQLALPKAEKIVRAVDEFREAIGTPATLKGTVSIGTIDSVVHSFLPRLMERIQSRYPGIAIDLNVDTSLNVSREIAEKKIDLAFLMGPIPGSGLINVDLGTYRCVWVANPKFDMAGRPLGLADLARHPILAFSKGSTPHQALLQQFRDAGMEPPTISNSNSLATIVRLASDGFGVAILPRAVLNSQMAHRKLRELDVTPTFPPLALHAVYPDHPDNLIISIIARMAAEESLAMADY